MQVDNYSQQSFTDHFGQVEFRIKPGPSHLLMFYLKVNYHSEAQTDIWLICAALTMQRNSKLSLPGYLSQVYSYFELQEQYKADRVSMDLALNLPH